jgi:predicted RNA binding protein YcfA (HicA-like mRNA interferase family)
MQATRTRWSTAPDERRPCAATEVWRILESLGFSEDRRRGSHVVMQRRTADSTNTVPVPDHREARIGTLQSIIRQSGVPKALFES